MKLLKFFTRNKHTPAFALTESILDILEFIPDYYRSDRRFKSSVELLENNEFGLAVEFLIDLADESGHYFSEDFWLGLADCADQMKMTAEADYCRKQIERNKSETGFSGIKGWTTVKLGNNLFEHHIAEKIKNHWIQEWRKKDKLQRFISVDGFHFKPEGRTGTLYYIEQGKVLEIDLEMSGIPEFDILLFFENASSWALPVKQDLLKEEKQRIKEKLIEWLKKKKLIADF